MTGIVVNVNVTGRETVIEALSNLALEPDNLERLLDEIGINLVENNRLRFTSQKTPDGDTWPRSIRASKQGGETLRDTGRLLASITHDVSSDSVEIGTNVQYAPYIHFGARIKAVAAPNLKFKIPGVGWVSKKEVTLPERPFLGIDSDDETLILSIIGGFLTGE